jgi:hypothetical protein
MGQCTFGSSRDRGRCARGVPRHTPGSVRPGRHCGHPRKSEHPRAVALDGLLVAATGRNNHGRTAHRQPHDGGELRAERNRPMELSRAQHTHSHPGDTDPFRGGATHASASNPQGPLWSGLFPVGASRLTHVGNAPPADRVGYLCGPARRVPRGTPVSVLPLLLHPRRAVPAAARLADRDGYRMPRRHGD